MNYWYNMRALSSYQEWLVLLGKKLIGIVDQKWNMKINTILTLYVTVLHMKIKITQNQNISSPWPIS